MMFGFPYNESDSDGVCTPAATAGNLDDRAKCGVRDIIMEIVAGRVIHGFVSATGNAALQVQNLTLLRR